MAHEMDPIKSHTDRLYLFWESYDKERELLKKWHKDPIIAGGSVNPLYQSFLVTWGEGDFESEVPLDKKSYFAALNVASDWILDKCLTLLEQGKDGKAKLDADGKPVLAQGKTEKDAQNMTKELFETFTLEKTQLSEMDQETKKRTRLERDPNSYLHVLNRLMEIETECFDRQATFLDTGEVPKHSVPTA